MFRAELGLRQLTPGGNVVVAGRPTPGTRPLYGMASNTKVNSTGIPALHAKVPAHRIPVSLSPAKSSGASGGKAAAGQTAQQRPATPQSGYNQLPPHRRPLGW